MVSSRINADVVYPESKEIVDEDKGFETTLYEMADLGKSIVVTLGKPKYTFSNKKIVYYPIYVVNIDNKVDGQIGVFEVENKQSLNVFDDEGDIDITKLGEPLYYDFTPQYVNKLDYNLFEYLQQWDKPAATPVQSAKDSPPEVLPDTSVLSLSTHIPELNSEQNKQITKILEKGVFTINDSITTVPLQEETDADAAEIIDGYSDSTRNSWIQKFMKNTSYDIHDVEANGDCFFAVVRDAFKQIGRETTVAKLRAILATEVTDDIFQEHRNIYMGFKNTVIDLEATKKAAKTAISKLKTRAKSSTKQQIEGIIAEVKALKLQHDQAADEIADYTKLIDETVGDLDGVNTFSEFKDYVQTSKYWADEWAIQTIEKKLNVKIIIFSETAYDEEDENGVLQCNHMNLEKTEQFAPDYYIMATYSDNHYRLVSYKQRKILTFSEIPYSVKTLIVNKCVEKNSGVYYLIQDFRNFKSKLGLDPDMGQIAETDEEEHRLHDDTVFVFYNKSEKSAYPGMGNGETIPKSKVNKYIALSKIPDWRKKLDDYWEEPFEVAGQRYLSVEHYYQGSKFRKMSPAFSKLFALNSNSNISKNALMAHSAGSETSKHIQGNSITTLRPADVQVDDDFYPERSAVERELAVKAKFTQNEDLNQVLQLTGNALLLHYISKGPPKPDYILMKQRQ